MGVQQELGDEVTGANRVQRITQRFASTRPGAWTFAKTAHHLDRLVLRATGGRATLAAVVARDADADEHAQVLRTAAAIYPGYDRYRERITGRVIPVLVLEVASAA